MTMDPLQHNPTLHIPHQDAPASTCLIFTDHQVVPGSSVVLPNQPLAVTQTLLKKAGALAKMGEGMESLLLSCTLAKSYKVT